MLFKVRAVLSKIPLNMGKAALLLFMCLILLEKVSSPLYINYKVGGLKHYVSYPLTQINEGISNAGPHIVVTVGVKVGGVVVGDAEVATVSGDMYSILR